MHDPLLKEIIRSIEEAGFKGLPADARSDLTAFFPQKYAQFEKTISDYLGIGGAREDYLSLIRMYMINEKIPLTVENMTCGFLWGFRNLKERGLAESPQAVKRIVGYVRHSLEPEAIRIEERYLK